MANKVLTGKKLLVLGATSNEIPLVKRAQELGVYVITTDYNINRALSPAKLVSNEAWDISWSDIDVLVRQCKESGVDGITAGFSEIRVDNLIKLCNRLSLPCYINDHQLAVTRDKFLFKRECRKYGIPTIREYPDIAAVDKYPVIVKPVDRAGSIGVGIAHNRKELKEAYIYAMEKSLTGSVIIEEYVTNAIEMDAHYAVCGEEIILLTTDDIIPAANNQSDGKVVQSAWLYPSRYDEEFAQKVDPGIRRMIRGMGIEDGTIFFSGFVNEIGEFSFFECGFRLWGEQEFSYDQMMRGINYLDIYIYHALTGETSAIERTAVCNPHMKGVELNLYVQGGSIASVEGLKETAGKDECYLCINSARLGQECPSDVSILYKAGLIGFASTSLERLKCCIDQAYEVVKIKNQVDEDMIYDRINTELIEKWWRR